MRKGKPTKIRPTMHTQPKAVRQKLAKAYRRQSVDRRFTPAERKEFARMAEAWQRTVDAE